MNDWATGKRMVEEMMLEHILDSYPVLSNRKVVEYATDAIPFRDPPDFVVNFDDGTLGIELAEIRDVDDAWDYYDTASWIAGKKSKSYERRDLFRFRMALIFHSRAIPLFDISNELSVYDSHHEFDATGFTEVWSIDLNEAYFSPGHPFKRADMFCFKPKSMYGFHRIGDWGRKPFG